MIDIVFLIIAIYVSIFTWITKKDIKSNEKNDFYVPASFIIAFSVIGVTVLFDGSDYGTVLSVILLGFCRQRRRGRRGGRRFHEIRHRLLCSQHDHR